MARKLLFLVQEFTKSKATWFLALWVNFKTKISFEKLQQFAFTSLDLPGEKLFTKQPTVGDFSHSQ